MSKSAHELPDLAQALRQFDARVRRTDGCWLWKGYIRKDGYGAASICSKSLNAHRLSWILHYGPIPTSLFVMHKCDVRACVNPFHLVLGTALDNSADMAKKGRSAFQRADFPRRGQAKLSLKDVEVIKDLRAKGFTLREIGEKFGVHKVTIHLLLAGKTWKNDSVTS